MRPDGLPEGSGFCQRPSTMVAYASLKSSTQLRIIHSKRGTIKKCLQRFAALNHATDFFDRATTSADLTPHEPLAT